MRISYDMVIDAFLQKLTEFEFVQMDEFSRTEIVDGYLKRAAAAFRKNCKYDLTAYDDILREFLDDFDESDVDELIDILSEGMIVQWLKPYVYRQEVLENSLNTNDFTTYSPANQLAQLNSAYSAAQKNYTQMIREYSYNHGDLRRLHI